MSTKSFVLGKRGAARLYRRLAGVSRDYKIAKGREIITENGFDVKKYKNRYKL